MLLKLYKNIDGQINYWETWDSEDKTVVIHWGIIGQQGDRKSLKPSFFSSLKKQIDREIDRQKRNGYSEIDIEDQQILVVEYTIDGMGDVNDIDKRYRLQDRLNETLGWTGLGMCDGGSIGSGTMEAACFVVDFEIAKQVIEADLKNSEFADYTRIYNENED